ncbi:hypothetical protein CHLRE_16g691600v5 [Chlamydomonas reinhardtii]|uniref:Uncharacterized protein n=1 Tax=Chlamydomonas reinhardtii TaxID=3055 RepID=A0A2K3CSI0_CHLRE|nr:uncharacterized protein CHLRE_16g691600v5 [Chlamydomonas reinhardtii]PNW71249.1 hypothetical protein CHLRE_16g691600v5 [Chlamydomonas reinhardtii]
MSDPSRDGLKRAGRLRHALGLWGSDSSHRRRWRWRWRGRLWGFLAFPLGDCPQSTLFLQSFGARSSQLRQTLCRQRLFGHCSPGAGRIQRPLTLRVTVRAVRHFTEGTEIL